MFGVRIGDDVEGFARPDVVLKEGEKPQKGTLTYIDSMGNEQTMPEGAFVFMAGDATTDAYKANLELFLVDHIRRSPAQASLRKLALDRQMGGLTDAQRQAVLQSDQIQDFDPNLLLNMDMMFMLKKGEDGRYYEAPLINVQKVLQEISYDTVYHVDPNIRRHSDKALEEWDRVANRMRSEAKRDQEQNETAYRLIDREFQSMDKGPRDFFTEQFEKGDAGSLDSNILRMKIIERAELEAVANGATEAEKLKAVEEATRIYDEARQRHFAAWVTSKTEGSIDGMKATRIDPATDGKGRAIPVKGFKGQELLRIMGADGGPYAEENAEMFRKLLDDDEHYEKLQAVAEWAITKQNRVPSGGQMEGVPTGLSIESWISRIYSINRGVVSPRYVGAEALIQSFRMQGLSLVEAMVTDPKLAARVEKILISGKPLPTEQENYELMQSLMTAGAMYLTRTEYAQETQEPIGSNIPIEISQPTSVEEQMQQVVPQIQEVTNQTGMTQ